MHFGSHRVVVLFNVLNYSANSRNNGSSISLVWGFQPSLEQKHNLIFRTHQKQGLMVVDISSKMLILCWKCEGKSSQWSWRMKIREMFGQRNRAAHNTPHSRHISISGNADQTVLKLYHGEHITKPLLSTTKNKENHHCPVLPGFLNNIKCRKMMEN